MTGVDGEAGFDVSQRKAGQMFQKGNGVGADRQETLTYVQQLQQCRLLEKEEEIELARKIRKGDTQAFQALVNANLRFVVSVAKKYRGTGIPLQDLISEGTLGLMKAAERFDPEYRVKFITYAVWWIRCAILEAMCKYAGITRMPVSQARLLTRIRRSQKALEQSLGRAVSLDEVAEYSSTEVKKLEMVTTRSLPYASLEAPAGEEDEPALAEYIEDGAYDPGFDAYSREELKTLLSEALSCLDARQAEILSLYYGLDGSPPLTLDAIGTRYGISRERVRQIREAALRKVRHSLSESQIDLQPYLSCG
jgi:RNA polymerase primary sigma factor